MELPASTACRGLSAQIAEQAVGDAVQALCRGGSWLGLAAGSAGARSPTVVEISDRSRRSARLPTPGWDCWSTTPSGPPSKPRSRGWHEYLQEHPGDEKNAAVAATLDANEEATRQIAAGYAQVLESLVADGAAGSRIDDVCGVATASISPQKRSRRNRATDRTASASRHVAAAVVGGPGDGEAHAAP